MKLSLEKSDEFIDYICSEDSLFHYTRRSVALEKILFENVFKLSVFQNSNDPHEYRSKLFGVIGYEINGVLEKVNKQIF